VVDEAKVHFQMMFIVDSLSYTGYEQKSFTFKYVCIHNEVEFPSHSS